MPGSLAEIYKGGRFPGPESRHELEHHVNTDLFWSFRGQGWQKQGMFNVFLEEDDESQDDHAASIITFADRHMQPKMGKSMMELCANGQPEELAEFASEIIFTANAAYLSCLVQDGNMFGFTDMPGSISGSSLGIYSALLPLGIVSFADGLDIVHERNKGLREANRKNPGRMLATPLPHDHPIILNAVRQGDAWVGLVNGNSQTVLSIKENKTGDRTEKVASKIEDQLEGQKEKDAVIILTTSGGFHSPLMEPAIPYLEAALRHTLHEGFTTKTKLLGNTKPDGPHGHIRISKTVGELREELIDQLTNTVWWMDVVNTARKNDAKIQAEIGAPPTLTRLSYKDHGGTQKMLKLARRAAPFVGATLLFFAEREIEQRVHGGKKD